MANILLNTVCNLKCPYCFAEECIDSFKNDISKQNISRGNFIKALDFISKTDSRIGILGGEPTIHPDFGDIVNILINHKGIESFNLFSNGINLDKYFDLITNKKCSMLLNFNSPTITGRDNYSKMLSNVEYLMGKMPSQKINFGLNIYDKEQDIDYIIEVLRKYRKHSLRISTVVPNSVDKRGVNALDYFNDLKPFLFKLFSKLKAYEIIPNSDCNYIPTCIYTDKEYKWLMDSFNPLVDKYGDRCNIFTDAVCHGGPIDIYPDLSVARCFGFSEYDRVHLDNFNNLNEIKNYFIYSIENLSYYISNDEKCKECKKRKTLNCSGGCMSFKIEQIKQIKEKLGDI